MATQITEYRASDIEARQVPGGAMLMVVTDKGPVTIVLTIPALQKLIQQLAHQTKPEQSHGNTPSDHRSENL